MREQIRQLVSRLQPFDEVEKQHISTALEWIDSKVDLFRRSSALPDPHLVAYFVVISCKKDQILLVDHKRAKLWLPAGGHVEPDEHPFETVKREAKEELNIEAEFVIDEPLFLTVTPVETHTDITLWYLLYGDPEEVFNFDEREFQKISWFALEDTPLHLSDPHLSRFVKKIKTLIFS